MSYEVVEQSPFRGAINTELGYRHDAATWFAEVLDGPMRTPFAYDFDGNELYAASGEPMKPVFTKALINAQEAAAEDPALQFELRRRWIEQGEYRDMLSMMRGDLPNTMVVVSDCPPEIMQSNTSGNGYNADRRQTMLRVLCRQDGQLKMYSQSLDKSDRQSLEAIYEHFGITPEAGELLGQRIVVDLSEQEQNGLTDHLMQLYDNTLAEQYGGAWHAGRAQHYSQKNTYDFAREQHDILEHYVRLQLRGAVSEIEYYNMAALITERFRNSGAPAQAVPAEAVVQGYFGQYKRIEAELARAGALAQAAGKSFDGCGLSVTSGAQEQLEAAGLGHDGKADEDQYGPLSFTCKNGHSNRRPRGKLISSCRVAFCSNSVACEPPKPKKQSTATVIPLFAVKKPEAKAA